MRRSLPGRMPWQKLGFVVVVFPFFFVRISLRDDTLKGSLAEKKYAPFLLGRGRREGGRLSRFGWLVAGAALPVVGFCFLLDFAYLIPRVRLFGGRREEEGRVILSFVFRWRKGEGELSLERRGEREMTSEGRQIKPPSSSVLKSRIPRRLLSFLLLSPFPFLQIYDDHKACMMLAFRK